MDSIASLDSTAFMDSIDSMDSTDYTDSMDSTDSVDIRMNGSKDGRILWIYGSTD
jgi:hypothetical protein